MAKCIMIQGTMSNVGDDDPGLPVLGAHADGHEEIRRRELPLYDGAAEVARERGRFHRGDDPGTEGRKGVLS